MKKNKQKQTIADQNETNEKENKESNLDYKEAWIRATADYQNLQKEMEAKRKEWVNYANMGLLRDLLPVIDHYKQALNHIPEEQKEQDWVKGIIQIKKQLDEFMKNVHLEEIPSVGEKFDPELHEAIGRQKSEDAESDHIINEVSGGYKLNGKVIMAAKVIVSE